MDRPALYEVTYPSGEMQYWMRVAPAPEVVQVSTAGLGPAWVCLAGWAEATANGATTAVAARPMAAVMVLNDMVTMGSSLSGLRRCSPGW